MERAFPVDIIEHGEQRMPAAKIECSKCEGTAFHIKAKGINPLAHEQHFRRLGWRIGNGPRADLCPECQKRGKPELKVVTMEQPKADPPREMGREERRIITDKLDEVYDDKGTKYKTPWTDAAVARDLGVPRAWVSDVREQFFGPEGSNPEFDDFIQQAAPIIADMKNLAKSACAQLEQVRAVEVRIAELERVARRIDKELGR